jgi:hypothetical protein
MPKVSTTHTPTADEHAVDRVLWLLYTDANTRFNLLIDECGHLRETIDSLLPEAMPGSPQPSTSTTTAERPWLPPDTNIRDPLYYLRTPQERALRNLWMTMGAVAEALEANKHELRRRYRLCVLQARAPASDAIYWFVSLRGHFLEHIFPRYLDQLQHAHEKLVQLIENMPGALPGPTLLRRWSSGGYGEFLSEYSRQVNHRVQDLCWKMCYGDGPGSSTRFEAWREKQFLVHTWSHKPTSYTWLSRVHHEGSETPLAFATIWSSYFYLEQPILFPLLYHECAHHLFDDALGVPEHPPSVSSEAEHARSLWTKRPKETAALLERVARFESPDLSKWKDLVNECWADAVSIALCGESFVVALALQLIGIQGDDKSFSDFEPGNESRIPLDLIGTPPRQILSAHYPTVEQCYFWETRLALAVKTLEALEPKADGATVSRGILALIGRWQKSGGTVMAAAAASHEHATYWNYRERLNHWLENVLWAEMREYVAALKERMVSCEKVTENELNPKIIDVLRQGVSKYAQSLFGEPLNISVFPGGPNRYWYIEDVCVEIRWSLSDWIVRELRDTATSADHDGELSPFKKWAETYADYMRSDGSIAFRLAIEWTAARKDVVRTAARMLHPAAWELPDFRSTECGLTEDECKFLEDLAEALELDLAHQEKLDKRELARQLAQKPVLTPKDSTKWPHLADFMSKFEDDLAELLRTPISGAGLDVGTLSLGVVRPIWIGANGSYGNALVLVEDHFKKSSDERNRLVDRVNLEPHSRTKWPLSEVNFMPLFGEYNFCVYEQGYTPVEKDLHPDLPPQFILKSRAVVRTVRADEKRKAGQEFCRVSQIAYRYRWQWVVLAKKVRGEVDMLLSSAWEDIILVSYHSLESYKDETMQLGLGLRVWQDAHSSVGLVECPPASAVKRSPALSESNLLTELKASGVEAYPRTGRYDLSIDWGTESPKDLFSKLNSIADHSWKKMWSMVHSQALDAEQPGRFNLRGQVIQRHEWS